MIIRCTWPIHQNRVYTILWRVPSCSN